jgi:hypothetical protein
LLNFVHETKTVAAIPLCIGTGVVISFNVT